MRLAVCVSWVGKLLRQNVKKLIQGLNAKNSALVGDALMLAHVSNRYRQESANRGSGVSGALRLRYNELLHNTHRAVDVDAAEKKKNFLALRRLEGLEEALHYVEMMLSTDLLRTCVKLVCEEQETKRSRDTEDEHGGGEEVEGKEEEDIDKR